MDKTRNFLALIKGKLWLLPLILTLGSAIVAVILILYGNHFVSSGDGNLWWLYSGDAETGRQLLSSLLSGLMTMTSLVISVTFVILTLAANQLGPRLISRFMADRQIQTVLGLFIGTILYLILVLRSVTDKLGEEGVPHLAITTGSALTVLCLLALLFYIHKVARSIIADNMVQALYSDMLATMDSVLPPKDTPKREPLGARFAGPRHSLAIGTVGHVQVVGYALLLDLAVREDIRMTVHVRAGQYLLAKGDHVTVFASEAPEDDTLSAIRAAFTIGSERTPAQDLEFGIRQLTEIAVRALSPGINDPFTALAVIDRISAIIEGQIGRAVQPTEYRDDDDDLRLIVSRTDLRRLMDAGFRPIRQAGADHPAILARMAIRLADLAVADMLDAERAALSAQIEALAQAGEACACIPVDRDEIRAQVEAARSRISDTDRHADPAAPVPPSSNRVEPA
ncbi:hypothetical protein ASE36_03115 [Rhizobium sp. Root274]|uniref:DUF2254 domain-containing protein n=1 Tax=unclassified Rhizobium TaxID=2613769 RepID=UPI000715BCCC|nr:MULTISPECIES: DUF2254 domain-containing protein [unclassified Rhizobium]KQW31275.1 hypothetical protein ASC71_03110 [Rhizobium sp. Root1240]KRD32821.1 hypothetical protein ASE36_03115 [Rhizobium sp. Root274]